MTPGKTRHDGNYVVSSLGPSFGDARPSTCSEPVPSSGLAGGTVMPPQGQGLQGVLALRPF